MSGRGPQDATTGAESTVLRSTGSAVLLDQRGDVELAREARGASMEWGGVYGQLVRLAGRWTVSFELEGRTVGLPETLVDRTVDGERFQSTHRSPGIEVRQQIVPLEAPFGALRAFQLRVDRPGPRRVVATSSFVPFLVPVLVEGIRPVEFRAETRATEVRLRNRGFGLAFRWDAAPSRLYLDQASWRGGRRQGPIREVGSDHEVEIGPDGTGGIRIAILGGLERDLPGEGPERLWEPAEVGQRLKAGEEAWLASTPELGFPDAPELEIAYRQARGALHRLYTAPGDGITGLVAGYPWYASIWGRDLAWMLPAVLWLGDFAWARASIETVLRFQANARLPLVAAEPGELPMQLSPGPIFLFGTSDTTLHYPGLVLRHVRHAAEPEFGDRAFAAVQRALAWGERRTEPATGLLRNGGEVEEAERSEGTLLSVRYGIEAKDTTIWDSADRRDHAIDVQVLWADALSASLELGSARWTEADRERLRQLLVRVRATIPGRYAWPEERYLADTLRDGGAVRRLRPNALRAVSAGLLAPETARSLVHRAAEEDLTTPWGVRTLSSRDPTYSPTAYHDGQVWTIATAWAADAAYAAGEAELGLAYLQTIAARYRAEGGSANECYRGDRAEPFNSCFLLGFSVAPFLTTLFERLWGLSIDGRGPQLAVRPSFPPTWRTATIQRLRIGHGQADLLFDQGQVHVSWSGPEPLQLIGRSSRTEVAPGGSGTVNVRETPSSPQG